MGGVFINYRRQDTEGYVGRLYDHLIQHIAQNEIFMDVASIDPGADFVTEIENAVAACDVFITMIGPAWVNVTDDAGENRLRKWNDYVRLEIASAIKQEKFIIPILVGRATMPILEDLPEDIQYLARRNALELSHNNFADDVGKLVEAIKPLLQQAQNLKPKPDNTTVLAKGDQLKELRIQLVGATDSPLYQYRVDNRYFPILGEGNPDANIMFIGEAPSKYDAEAGQGFQGPSGKILDEMLETIALDRKTVYMTNIVMDRLPDNRNPEPEEIAFYTPFLDRIIEIVQPRVIVPLGRFAMTYILNKYDTSDKKGKISQLHGKLMKATTPQGDLHIVPMYYPAVAIYQPTKKDVLRKDFEKLRLFI
jgi:uracil-DNA glycosylase